MSNTIVEYYRGNGETFGGYSLEQVLAWDNHMWECCHDFIQWTFPTRKRSAYQPDAPILTDEDIKIIRSDELIQKNFKDHS